MKFKFLYTLLTLALIPVSLWAQRPEVEMADTFRADGKIYVVISILSLIFLGIAAYLYSIDRKISKLEDKD